MNTAAELPIQARSGARKRPPYLFDTSFAEPGAEQAYGGDPAGDSDESQGFMPDGQTRDCSKHMHYAVWRACHATDRRDAARWRRRYLSYRDRIVLGNQKLAFRAVHMRGVAVAT